MKGIWAETVGGVATVRAALVAAAAISAVCWTWIMLEYEVHPWLMVLTAGAATGVAAGILQHRGLAIVYVVATGVALLDIFVYSTSDGTLRFTVLVGSTLVGFALGIAAIRVFGRAKT